jgi:hypothetical protein
MPPGARRATFVAVIACLAAPAAAAAQDRPPTLVAQLAQAAPTPGPGEEPELTDKPPTELSGKSGDSSGNEGSTPRRRGPAASSLADTGSDAGIVALAGLSLLGWGVALRLRLRDAA